MSDLTFIAMLNLMLLGAILTSIVVNIREIRKIDRLLYGKKVKRKWRNRA